MLIELTGRTTTSSQKIEAKVFSLLMGQCTVPLKDKMKEDLDWHDIANKYDHIRLLLLIKKTVLKQTESKNPYQCI